MRKLILLAAFSALAGTASTLTIEGQAAFPVTAVGYMNIPEDPGLNPIGLQLDSADRSILGRFHQPPEGSTIYRMVDGTFTENIFENGQWQRPDETILVGEGVFIFNPTSENNTIT